MSRLAALTLVFSVGLFSCGGGVDADDPDAVAEAIARASFDRGGEGRGVIYDLTLPAERDDSREEKVESQSSQGCVPQGVSGDLEVVLEGTRGDFRLYAFTPAGEDQPAVPSELIADDESGQLAPVETDNGWRYVPDAFTVSA